VSDTRERCEGCYGSGRMPFPRGMSAGFHAFMGAGCKWDGDRPPGMVCPRCEGTGRQPDAALAAVRDGGR
jgi:hypothetical protein